MLRIDNSTEEAIKQASILRKGIEHTATLAQMLSDWGRSDKLVEVNFSVRCDMITRKVASLAREVKGLEDDTDGIFNDLYVVDRPS